MAIVVVGGSTLAVRGWVERVTQDVDVIARAEEQEGGWLLLPPKPLPAAFIDAVARVARDFGLPDDWLNTEIGSQWAFGLPAGFAEEVDWEAFGALTVGFAGRQSLITLKLFAAADRSRGSVHFQDLLALAPSDEELEQAAEWVLGQDASEHFPNLVREVTDHVRRDLGRDPRGR